jgi:hypothetical protein
VASPSRANKKPPAMRVDDYSYVEMQPQVLLVGVREALAKKTSFQYNVYWLPTANKIVKDVFYV